MIIYLRGTDSYLASQAINQLKEKYLAKNPDGAELREISPESEAANWADLQAVPLFATSRLVIIRQVGQLPAQAQADLAKFLADLPPTTNAVVWDGRALAPTSQLATILKAASKIIPVEPLQRPALRRWLEKQAVARGLELQAEKIDELLDVAENDLWRLENDLEQLALGGEASDRSAKAAEPFLIFRLVRQGNWLAVRRHLASEIQAGQPIELLLGSLAAAVRKDLPPSEEKAAVTELMMDVDVGLKTGLLDDQMATAVLVSHLPKPRSERVRWERVYEDELA